MHPRTTLEKLARRVFDVHTQHLFPGAYDMENSAIEWWCQVREVPGLSTKRTRKRKHDAKDVEDLKAQTIGFHWDKDEELVDMAGLNIHPQVPRVLEIIRNTSTKD